MNLRYNSRSSEFRHYLVSRFGKFSKIYLDWIQVVCTQIPLTIVNILDVSDCCDVALQDYMATSNSYRVSSWSTASLASGIVNVALQPGVCVVVVVVAAAAVGMGCMQTAFELRPMYMSSVK